MVVPSLGDNRKSQRFRIRHLEYPQRVHYKSFQESVERIRPIYGRCALAWFWNGSEPFLVESSIDQ